MIQAIIFNLDGVLVTTDACHYRAWTAMTREYQIPFGQEIYQRMRGRSRREGLNLLLNKTHRNYSEAEKIALDARKNDLYLDEISQMTAECLLPGALDAIQWARDMGLKLAVESSSQNAGMILKQLNLRSKFDVLVDGNQVEHIKPNPELFERAAAKLKLPPQECFVIENAVTGIEAAHRAGMKALGIGPAALDPRADFYALSLEQADLQQIIQQLS